MAALLLVAACVDEPPRAPTTGPDVLWAGCATVLDDPQGPTCLLDDTTVLRLWVARIDRPAMWIDGREVDPHASGIDGGWQVRSTPGSESRQIEIETDQGRWSLNLGPAPVLLPEAELPATLPEADDIPAAAERFLRQELPSLAPADRSRALKEVAYSFPVDDASQAGAKRRLLQRAVDESRALGRLSDAIDVTTLIVQSSIYDSRYLAAADAILAGLGPPSARWPAESRYLIWFYRGVLGRELGDRRSSLQALATAAQLAKRTGMDEQRDAAEQVLGWQLRLDGRHQEAHALAKRLYEERLAEALECDEVTLLNNLAWDRLLARESGQTSDDPIPLLETALERLETVPCKFPAGPRNVLINLAMAHEARAEVGLASEYLDRARAVASPLPLLEQLVWIEDIAARIALRAGSPERALAHFDALEDLAARALSSDARWRAAVGRGRAHQALGQTADALDAFARAETLLDAESRRVPIDAGRALFVTPREPATKAFVGLLLEAGRASEALDVVRRARVRAFRSLHRGDTLHRLNPAQRAELDRRLADYQALRDDLDAATAEDWQRPADQRAIAAEQRDGLRRQVQESLDRVVALFDAAAATSADLPDAGHGELQIAMFPTDDGWFALAGDANGTEAVRLGDDPANLDDLALAERLLVPLADRIARAGRVRFLPYGGLRTRDFHALPFRGDVLLARVSIAYGFDLPSEPGLDEGAPLIVVDPRGDLPAARRDAEAVSAALRSATGRDPMVLADRQATAEAVRDHLDAVVLHYAGHGVFAGPGGFDSALPLAGGSTLAVGDILTAPRVPRLAVLLGCETARSDAAASAEAVGGLAQAFLAAGSETVVAAMRPVGDTHAARLAEAFYRAWTADPSRDVAAALRRAQLELREAVPEADWASFRVLSR